MQWRVNACGGVGRLLLLMVASLPMVAAAEVYTGVGAHGVRWFSDTPPAQGAHYDVVQITVTPPPAAGALPDQGRNTPKVRKNAGARAKPDDVRVAPPADKSAASPRQRIRRTQDEARQQRCRSYETALRKLRAQRRTGYTAEQDRRQRQRRAELQEKQYHECFLRAGA